MVDATFAVAELRMHNVPADVDPGEERRAGTEQLMRVSVQPCPAATRAPCDVCCVVDVSYSMDNAATMRNDAGNRAFPSASNLEIINCS